MGQRNWRLVSRATGRLRVCGAQSRSTWKTRRVRTDRAKHGIGPCLACWFALCFALAPARPVTHPWACRTIFVSPSEVMVANAQPRFAKSIKGPRRRLRRSHHPILSTSHLQRDDSNTPQPLLTPASPGLGTLHSSPFVLYYTRLPGMEARFSGFAARPRVSGHMHAASLVLHTATITFARGRNRELPRCGIVSSTGRGRWITLSH